MVIYKKTQFPSTFLFYDYETFGLHPIYDRIAQFACVRTNMNLEIISQPITLYCQIPTDYLPNLQTINIHNFNYHDYFNKYLLEYKFAKYINNIFTQHNTCIVGYNNIAFDDEFSRFLFYRNFYDAYNWSWKNDNSRWDILNLARACCVLRPEGIIWPKHNHIPIFNLAEITKVNNLSLHAQSHDALNDVYSTIALAKLIKTKQPLLFNYFFKNRLKKELFKIINLFTIHPLIYISAIYKNMNNNLGCIVPLCLHPYNKNILVVFDLQYDVNFFIKIYYHYKIIDISDNLLPFIKFIYLNKSPIIIPIKILKKNDIQRLKFNITLYLKHFVIFKQYVYRVKKIVQRYLYNISTKNILYKTTNIYNVDTQLYKQFFPMQDQKKFYFIRKIDIYKNQIFNFIDGRINFLLLKYKARNFTFLLNDIEIIEWNKYLFDKYKSTQINNYITQIKNLLCHVHIKTEHKLFLNKLLLSIKTYLICN
ncbi:exodeoxyribonuclease I [Enterobacteriaceae endosymbiont of Macroplea appendiculata]|uniref:exodeoxyribonuclease I n=1 Tax=Enterobacteriaceae endosymbiont of Macroplea appendiculata TaxID=2675790 RepID=UPI00145670D9|nr:exodeoxyribonuclease I [Enterobacteriaceae endosymbiont of Macroplea appendiculata]